jgi:RNA polymerase sigma-70 factor (family 1)
MGNSDILKDLIKKIAENDSDAFAKFYDLFYIKVYRFSSYFLKSDVMCQEVVSDIFLSIWQSRVKLPGIDNVEAYLYTSTRHRALYYLNQSIQKYQVAMGDLPIGIVSHGENPEEIVLTDELRQTIEKSISELPERCRLIFMMAREEGLKYKEIAEILSISEKTVNAQMVTAIKRVGDALKKYLYMFLY